MQDNTSPIIPASTCLLWCALFMSILFGLLPWPAYLKMAQPHFTLIVLTYWMLFSPHTLPPLYISLIGVGMDALYGDVLGGRGLIWVLYIFFGQSLYLRILSFSFEQQYLVVSVSSVLAIWLLYAVQCLSAPVSLSLHHCLLSCLSTVFLLPCVFTQKRQSRPT